MNFIRTFLSTALTSALLFTTASLQASTVSECQQEIANLRSQTETITITGQQADKDRAGLLAKLDAASLKLDQGKFCDAITKLNDFKTKVNQLVAAGKINTDPANGTTAQDLLNGADAAINCIRDVAAQAGTTCP
jgi:hypothetical protein